MASQSDFWHSGAKVACGSSAKETCHGSLSEIAAIRLRAYRTAVRSAETEPKKWAPQTRETADHSIPYLVATALHDGAVTPESFSRAPLQHPTVQALMAKMTVDEEPDFSTRFPDEYPCWLEITTTAGQRHEAFTAYAPGYWRQPLSDDEVANKFRRLTANVLPAPQCDRALALLWALEQLPHFQELCDCLVVH